MNHRHVRARTLCALVALSLMLAAGVATAMDANELVAKAIEAQGGAAALHAVQSVLQTGKISAQGMEIPFTMLQARPLRFRADVSLMGMSIVQCLDGDKGWGVNPMGGSQDAEPAGDIEVKSLRLMADIDAPFLGWEAKGWTVEYLGKDDVEGTAAEHLRFDTKQDIVLDYWLDAESFLLLKENMKMKIDQGEFETQRYFSDFRQQDKLTSPFSIEMRRGDQVMQHFTVEKIEYNVAVDDAKFVMPAKKAAAADSTGN